MLFVIAVLARSVLDCNRILLLPSSISAAISVISQLSSYKLSTVVTLEENIAQTKTIYC